MRPAESRHSVPRALPASRPSVLSWTVSPQPIVLAPANAAPPMSVATVATMSWVFVGVVRGTVLVMKGREEYSAAAGAARRPASRQTLGPLQPVWILHLIQTHSTIFCSCSFAHRCAPHHHSIRLTTTAAIKSLTTTMSVDVPTVLAHKLPGEGGKGGVSRCTCLTHDIPTCTHTRLRHDVH